MGPLPPIQFGGELFGWSNSSVVRFVSRAGFGPDVFGVASQIGLFPNQTGPRRMKKAQRRNRSRQRAKSSFLANMSHEIRHAHERHPRHDHLALEYDIQSEQRGCLNTVKESGDTSSLSSMRFLDFSKIVSGKLELEPSIFNCAKLWKMRLTSVCALTKRLELACHIQAEVSDALIGESRRVRQSVLNSLAMHKFTEQGEVCFGSG